jgi:P4 family phage/plasmid primase-like protien
MTQERKPPSDPKPEGKAAPVVELKSKLPAADPVTGVRKKFYRFRHASHVELAKALVSQLEVIHEARVWAPVYDEGALHCYSPKIGIWERVGDVIAGKLVQAFDGDAVGQSRLKLKDKDILGALSCARREVWRDGFFSTAPPGLVFKDTHISIVDGVIKKSPHSTDNRARFAYDFEYVEDEPVAFLKAIRGMFKPDTDIEEKVRFIGEFAGVSLLGSATRLQRWVLLKGLGDDGKSTLIEMIRGAMPKGSTCSIKPEELENEYNRADLAGKLLNTVTEVRQRDVLDAETLKAVVAGDVMRGREIRQSPIDFHPKAGHIMAANGYPRFSDASHGFWRRPVVVTFNRRFTGDPERTVGLAEIILAQERPRIVCWLIRQGAIALGRGAFIEPTSHYRAVSEWRGETDAVYEYVEAVLMVADDLTKVAPLSGWTSSGKLYERFIEWAGATGHKGMSTTAFGRRLTELGHPWGKDRFGNHLRPLRIKRPGEKKPE